MAADPQNIGTLEQRQAAGWLQLEQDQRNYREGVEPLSPAQAAGLRRLERRQQGNLLEMQRRQLESLRRARRPKPGAEAQPRACELEEGLLKRQLDRQRLDMRIQRETQRPRWR